MGPEKEILLADDEHDIRDLFKIYLTSLGHVVSAFSDGEAAFRSFLENPFRYKFAILDLQMPRFSGEQLAMAIRNHNTSGNEGKTLPIGIASCGAREMPSEVKARLLRVVDIVVEKTGIIEFKEFERFVDRLSRIRDGSLGNMVDSAIDNTIASG